MLSGRLTLPDGTPRGGGDSGAVCDQPCGPVTVLTDICVLSVRARGLAVFAASLDGCVRGFWLASCEKGQVMCAGQARGFPAHTVLVLSPKTGSLEGMWDASRATGWKGPAAPRECLQQSGSPPAGRV